jgi:hypothetical protein
MTKLEMGRRRDQAILSLIERFGCLRRDQIERAMFSGRYAGDICRRRLRALTRKGALQRELSEPGGQYLYSTAKVGIKRHRLAVADIYLKMLAERRQGERIEFLTEYALEGHERADAFIIWHMVDSTHLAFLEVQRKGRCSLSKYNRYFRSSAWKDQAWSKGGTVFPRIIVQGTFRQSSRLHVVSLEGSVRRAVMG